MIIWDDELTPVVKERLREIRDRKQDGEGWTPPQRAVINNSLLCILYLESKLAKLKEKSK